MSSKKRVITIESRERRGSDPILASKRKDSQKVCNVLHVVNTEECRFLRCIFSPSSCHLAIVTLVTVARNVELNVKDLCRIYGGKLMAACKISVK